MPEGLCNKIDDEIKNLMKNSLFTVVYYGEEGRAKMPVKTEYIAHTIITVDDDKIKVLKSIEDDLIINQKDLAKILLKEDTIVYR